LRVEQALYQLSYAPINNSLLEAATGFEPVIKVLQTFALPLGHAAVHVL
jgi:hypothetical protein